MKNVFHKKKKKNSVLEVHPGDAKALFRRGQAYDYLGKTDEAFEDMRKICEIDKGNKGLILFFFFFFFFFFSFYSLS